MHKTCLIIVDIALSVVLAEFRSLINVFIWVKRFLQAGDRKWFTSVKNLRA